MTILNAVYTGVQFGLLALLFLVYIIQFVVLIRDEKRKKLDSIVKQRLEETLVEETTLE